MTISVVLQLLVAIAICKQLLLDEDDEGCLGEVVGIDSEASVWTFAELWCSNVVPDVHEWVSEAVSQFYYSYSY